MRFPDYAGEFPVINPRTTSPGAIGAWKVWTDISTPSAPVLKCRNATNTGDITLTGSGGGGGSSFTLRNGAGVPSAGLGADGDWYFDSTGGDVYKKAAGAWTRAVDFGTAAMLNVPVAGNAATTEVVKGSDTRLTDARTPVAHVHDAADVQTGVLATARLGTGAASGTTYLRGDGTWATIAGGGAVASVYGRTGAVVAATGDYTAAQVTNALDTSATRTANTLLAGPTSGAAAAPTFRALAWEDAPIGLRRQASTYLTDPISGKYVTTQTAGNNTVAGATTAQRLYATPFVTPTTFSCDKIGINVTTNAASQTARLGIYAAGSDGLPDALVVDAGNVSLASVGGFEATLASAQVLAAGTLYYLVVVSTSSATAISCNSGGASRAIAPVAALGSTGPGVTVYRDAVSGTLPANFGTPTGNLTGNVAPFFMLHAV